MRACSNCGSNACIDAFSIGAHNDAAQDRSVDVLAQHDLLAQISRELLGDDLAQVIVESHHSGDIDNR